MEYINKIISYFSDKPIEFKKPAGYKNVNTSSVVKQN